MRNVVSCTEIIFVKGSVSSWQPQGLCFHHPRGVVWGKKRCLSLTEQVLERDNMKVFLAGYCFRLCIRMREFFNVFLGYLSWCAWFSPVCMWLNQSTAREGKSKQEIKQWKIQDASREKIHKRRENLPKENCFLLASPWLLRKNISTQPLQLLEMGSLERSVSCGLTGF